MDEKIDVNKKEILVQKNTFETNQNNLNEMYFNPLSRLYTSPDQYSGSFTETMEVRLHRNISTRQSTESNESDVAHLKYFTPTHQNTKNYNFPQIQRELDFTKIQQNKFNMNQFFSPSHYMIPTNMKAFSFCVTGGISQIPKKTPFTETKTEVFDHKINMENILLLKDNRTTLMIRNIPNKYSLNNLVDEIINYNPSFAGKFDYINLPIDYERKLNLGYAFVNFLDPLHIVLFYEAFCGKKWQKYKSDKRIDLNYAEKQGKKDMNNKDENTFFATEDKKIIKNKFNPKIEIPIVRIFII